MIGTALMILVIGGQRSVNQMDYLPWDVDVLDNGATRVFGITLNKTRIQDANQILSSFPETRLIAEIPEAPQLVAYYDDINIGGFTAEIELEYKLPRERLQQLGQRAIPVAEKNYFRLEEATELELLGSTVSNLTYKPVIDYEIDMILQRFGPPERENKITEFLYTLEYPDLGLVIYINEEGQDSFVYSPVKPVLSEEKIQ